MGKPDQQLRQALQTIGLNNADLKIPAQSAVEKVIRALELQSQARSASIEQKYQSMRIGHHVESLLQGIAPQLPPVWKIMRRALRRQRSLKKMQCRVFYPPYLLDFAYPALKICIRLGDNSRGDDLLHLDGWKVLRFTEEDVRQKLKACVASVRRVYRIALVALRRKKS